MAQIIDGKACAAEMRAQLTAQIAQHREQGLRPPGLVTILVGEDPASRIYVGRKQRESREVGMVSESVTLGADVSMDHLLGVIRGFNARPDIDGILVQMPLPKGLDSDVALAAVDPGKDVDGLHPANQGALFSGRAGLRPCTPSGCLYLLDRTGVDPKGKIAVVVGRSSLVGKPVAMMLLERHATVVMCHSRTTDLAGEVRRADIVVAAVGVAEMIKGDWIKPGAVVLDVGINRLADGRIVGDVEFAGAAQRAAFITPVPGGVGQMTVAMLLRNTYDACLARQAAASATAARKSA